MAAYRDVLRLPGVAAVVGVGILARIPTTAATITLTLHVVLTLGQGYAAAGAVGAALTVGAALGAPLLGRAIDRRGLRPVIALTVVTEILFWGVAPFLGLPALVAGGFAAGVLGLPAFSVIRQSLAAVVPPAQRRAAFAVDSMSVELSYVVGPAAGSVVAVQVSTTVAIWAVGAGWVAAGIALWVLNPPVGSGGGPRDPSTPPRAWLDRRLVAALAATAAAVLVLLGSELAVIAGVQRGGAAWAIPIVNAVWCAASLAGGFAYGAAARQASLYWLVALLGVLTIPLAFAGPWWTYALTLIPAGLLCAPSLAASAEAVSGLAPEHARGLVMGLHGSAITLGGAAGTPIAGVLIDSGSPALAVLAVASTAIVVAAGAGLLARRPRSTVAAWPP